MNVHGAEQAQKRVGRAQAARALGDNNCAHCSVCASSPTARGHRPIAPLALPDHQASLRCGGRGRAALLPTRRAPPPTAESLQLRCCFSALGATPRMRLRTRDRQQGVNKRARRKTGAETGGATSGSSRARRQSLRSLQRARKQPHGPRPPLDRTVGSARPSGVAALRGARQSGAVADQARAAADSRITPAALLLLGARSHAADAPAHTRPSTRRQSTRTPKNRRRNGWGELGQLARSATIIAFTAACAQAAPRPAATAGSHRWLCQTIRRRRAAGGEAERRFCRPGARRRRQQNHSSCAAASRRSEPRRGCACAHATVNKASINAHAEEQAQKRVGRARAARALGDNNCVHCSVRASSSTARGHRWIAPLALPDHQASPRCGGRGRAALLPTRRAPPPTAESLQLRCCFSALGATPRMRLRTRDRQQGVNQRARRRTGAETGGASSGSSRARRQ